MHHGLQRELSAHNCHDFWNLLFCIHVTYIKHIVVGHVNGTTHFCGTVYDAKCKNCSVRWVTTLLQIALIYRAINKCYFVTFKKKNILKNKKAVQTPVFSQISVPCCSGRTSCSRWFWNFMPEFLEVWTLTLSSLSFKVLTSREAQWSLWSCYPTIMYSIYLAIKINK